MVVKINIAGSAVFSGIEIKPMSEFITSIRDKLFAHISFASLSLWAEYEEISIDNYNNEIV